MTYAQYQEHFEKTAEAEAKRFDAMPLAAVIAEIRAGRFGESYQIWHSLARRALPGEVNGLLLWFLSSPAEYLHRYHCAAALIQVNKLTEWKPEELSAASGYPVAENLEKVRAKLGAAA